MMDDMTVMSSSSSAPIQMNSGWRCHTRAPFWKQFGQYLTIIMEYLVKICVSQSQLCKFVHFWINLLVSHQNTRKIQAPRSLFDIFSFNIVVTYAFPKSRKLYQRLWISMRELSSLLISFYWQKILVKFIWADLVVLEWIRLPSAERDHSTAASTHRGPGQPQGTTEMEKIIFAWNSKIAEIKWPIFKGGKS